MFPVIPIVCGRKRSRCGFSRKERKAVNNVYTSCSGTRRSATDYSLINCRFASCCLIGKKPKAAVRSGEMQAGW